MKTTKLIRALWNDDRGQTTTEYILMLSVVVMIAMKFKTTIMNKLETATNNIGSNIDTITQNTGQ